MAYSVRSKRNLSLTMGIDGYTHEEVCLENTLLRFEDDKNYFLMQTHEYAMYECFYFIWEYHCI